METGFTLIQEWCVLCVYLSIVLSSGRSWLSQGCKPPLFVCVTHSIFCLFDFLVSFEHLFFLSSPHLSPKVLCHSLWYFIHSILNFYVLLIWRLCFQCCWSACLYFSKGQTQWLLNSIYLTRFLPDAFTKLWQCSIFWLAVAANAYSNFISFGAYIIVYCSWITLCVLSPISSW